MTFFSTAKLNYLNGWLENPTVTAAAHGGGVLAATSVYQKQEKLKLQKESTTLQKSVSTPTNPTKFAHISESVFRNNTKENIVSVSVSTNEVSNKLTRTVNPIATIAVDPKPAISPPLRVPSFVNSIYFWGLMGFCGVAAIQMLYYYLQAKNIIKKKVSVSEQFELLLENQNKILAILENQEKKLDQHEKTLEELQKKL